jgi:hypothetical protein
MRGYDNLRFNHEMLLDLQFCEGTGTITRDWAKPHHEPVTLTNVPTWTNAANDLTYLAFDGAAPYDHLLLASANCADLNFTSGAFSGMCWYYPRTGGNRYIFNRGLTTTGWCFYLNTSNRMSLGTKQAAVNQYSNGDVLTLNTWQLVGFNRSGATVRIYTNGRDETVTAVAHVNPDSAAAQNFYIGCTDAVGAGWMYGDLWRPRIWNRNIAAAEHLAIFEMERGLFGV